MRRKTWSCDIICHSPKQPGRPLHVLYDGSLKVYPSCFNREIEHRRGAKEIRLNK
jgi:hypothetical protein